MKLKKRRGYCRIDYVKGKKVPYFGKNWGGVDKKDANASFLKTGDGLFVIDIDNKIIPKKYQKWVQSLGKATVETKRGYHFYIKSDAPVKSHQNIFNDEKFKVDIRGKGGLVFEDYWGKSKKISYLKTGKVIKDKKYKIYKSLPKDVRERFERKPVERDEVGKVELSKIKKALKKVDVKDYRDRNRWMRILAAIYHGGGADAEKIARKWSKKDKDKYEKWAFDDIWGQLVRGEYGTDISAGTLFHAAYGEKIDPVSLFKKEKGKVVPGMGKRVKKKPKPKEFNINDFPKTIRNYIDTVSRSKGVPFGSLLPSILTSMASTVGDRTSVDVGAWSSKLHVWGLLVGNSGVRKSAIMSDGMWAYNKMRKDTEKDHALAVQKWKDRMHDIEASIKDCNKKLEKMRGDSFDFSEPKLKSEERRRDKLREDLMELQNTPPQGSVGVFEDVTDAALSQLLKQYESGILGYYPEAGSLEKLINSNNGHTETLRQIMLKGYSGESHTVHRSTLDDIILDKVNINLLGAIQPHVLSNLAKNGTADGFMGRFQFIYHVHKKDVTGAYEQTGKRVNEKHRDKFLKMFERLREGKFKKEYFVSKRGLKLMRKFEEEMFSEDVGGLWGEYLGKIPYSLNSLILLFHLATNPKEDVIDADIVKRAISVMRVFISHAKVVFKDVEKHSGKKTADKPSRMEMLTAYIKKHAENGLSMDKVRLSSPVRYRYGSYPTAKEIRKAAKKLGMKFVKGVLKL